MNGLILIIVIKTVLDVVGEDEVEQVTKRGLHTLLKKGDFNKSQMVLENISA